MNLDGTPAAGNPFYDPSDGIDAHDYGFRNPFSGSWRAADGFHYEVENGPYVDRFARIVPDYGWTGYDADMYINALYNWAPAIAPVNIAFVQPTTFGGSQFPAETSVVGGRCAAPSTPSGSPGPHHCRAPQHRRFVSPCGNGFVSPRHGMPAEHFLRCGRLFA